MFVCCMFVHVFVVSLSVFVCSVCECGCSVFVHVFVVCLSMCMSICLFVVCLSMCL